MKFLTRIALLLTLAFARTVAAKTLSATITPLTGSDRPWVTLAIAGLPDATAEITLQDARGGPAVSRKISPSTGIVILALPLIAPSDLTGSRWPINLIARDAAGNQLYSAHPVPTLKTLPAFRIALPQGTTPQAAAHTWPTTFPIEYLELPPQEILSAPAQSFAGFDALYIPNSLAGKIDEPRIIALRAAGPQVIIAGQTPPHAGLSKLLWSRLDNSPSPAWLCTSQAAPPLPLLLPDLAQLPIPSLAPSAGITQSLLLIGPAAIFLALITRALFRKPLLILGITAAAFLILAAATIAYLRTADPQTQSLAHWHTLIGSQTTPTGGIDTETQLTTLQTRFGHSFDFSASYIFPLTATPRAYWQLSNIQLVLNPNSMTLRATLQPRQQLLLQQQTPLAAGLVPTFPTTLEDRTRFAESFPAAPNATFWLIAGYIYPATAASLDTAGTLFSAWSRNQKEQPSLDTWYTLHFRADTKYFLQLNKDAPQIIEFPDGS